MCRYWVCVGCFFVEKTPPDKCGIKLRKNHLSGQQGTGLYVILLGNRESNEASYDDFWQKKTYCRTIAGYLLMNFLAAKNPTQCL